MRPSQKTILTKPIRPDQSINADFNLSEVESTVRNKGYDCIWEKAYLCPCKSRESDHLNTCKNCGGTGWVFANPTKTKMIITSIQLDAKLKEAALREWGMMDLGTVKVTALNEDKLTYMDRITILDATAEHQQILYPQLTADKNGESESDSGLEGQLFAFTKYDIVDIDYIGLFQGAGEKLKRLEYNTDYIYRDNILLLGAQYDALVDPCITVRYVHRPTYHITDLLRESFTSTQFSQNQGQVKMKLPIHALAKRAHLITDAENFDGDRLFDNSWKPLQCDPEPVNKFYNWLKYTSSQEIYNNLTETQRSELLSLLS